MEAAVPQVDAAASSDVLHVAIKRSASEGLDSGFGAKRMKLSHAAASAATTEPAAIRVPFPEKPAVIEERKGEIEFRVVNNDGRRESSIILAGLKCLFQKQLPEMPKDYVARLVYDRNHLSIALVRQPLEVIGGIAYREFRERRFAEIVFCAVTSDQQVKGYGAHLMAHFKDYVKATSPVQHFLTYADNYATGYFQKQGFTKDITLHRSVWMGYIKDYEGGTLMQCSMVPRIRYLEVGRMLLKQKETIRAKIRPLSQSHVIHAPPPQWAAAAAAAAAAASTATTTTTTTTTATSSTTTTTTSATAAATANGDSDAATMAPLPAIDPLSIPAIRATGWSPDMDALGREPRRGPLFGQLRRFLYQVQGHKQAWPFLNPVNREEVPDYDKIIKTPMDLSTMEKKLEQDLYSTPGEFVADLKLIVSNCRKFNDASTVYNKCAVRLEKFVTGLIKEIPEWHELH